MVQLTNSSFTVLWTALIQLLLWRDKRIAARRVDIASESEVSRSPALKVPAEADTGRISFEAIAIPPKAGPING